MAQHNAKWHMVKEWVHADYHVPFTIYEHESGMQLIHGLGNTTENSFLFCFATPPQDDTGVPHVLEHVVLGGSAHFRQKDPFARMIEQSAASYINALTGQEYTMYPASTAVKTDYWNLFRYYADGVFFPLLREETIKQEAMRREIDPADANAFVYNGVVYNELKGSLSSLDELATRENFRSLYPGTCYQYESGGEPIALAELGREAIAAYHREHYHPSRAKLICYGDIGAEEIMAELDSYILSRPELAQWQQPTPFELPELPRLAEPQRATHPYPSEESSADGCACFVSWRLGSIADPLEVMTLDLVTELLLGHAGAPLYKTLVESGLGKELSDLSGMDAEYRHAVFFVGLEGCAEDKAADVYKLIHDTMRRYAGGAGESERELDHAGGASEFGGDISLELITAALERISFRHAEAAAGEARGLYVCMQAAKYAYQGMSVADGLAYGDALKALKARIDAEGAAYVSRWIGEHFVENDQYSELCFVPDRDFSARHEAELSEQLRAWQEACTPEELEAARGEARAYEDYLEREDHSKLPIAELKKEELKDIPPWPKSSVGQICGIEVVQQELDTQGIVYATIIADLRHLDAEELMLMPLVEHLFLQVGTTGTGAGSGRGMSYDELSQLIQAVTGSAYMTTNIQERMDTAAACAYAGGDADKVTANGEVMETQEIAAAMLSLKFAEPKLSEVAELCRTLIADLDLGDESRIRQSINELIRTTESDLEQNGQTFALLAAMSSLSRSRAWSEAWQGYTLLQYLKTLRDSDHAALAVRLKAIYAKLFAKSSLLISGEAHWLEEAAAALAAVLVPMADLSLLAKGNSHKQPAKHTRLPELPAWVQVCSEIPSSGRTAFVGAAAALALPAADRPHMEMLIETLNTPLWEQIRSEMGAYGGGIQYLRYIDMLVGYSFRDPHAEETMKLFASLIDRLEEPDWEDIDRTISKSLGFLQRPKTPREEHSKLRTRYLRGYSFADELAYADALYRMDVSSLGRCLAHLKQWAETQQMHIAVVRS